MIAHPRNISPSNLFRYLEKTYGLRPKEPAHALASAPETAVWRVVAPPRGYIVKIFPADCLDAVRTEADIVDYLRSCATVQAPELLVGRDGTRIGRIAEPWRSLHWPYRYPIVVMRLERLRRVRAGSVTAAELTQIGRHMALMHRALRRYPRRAAIRRTERWGPHLGCFGDFLASHNARAHGRAEVASWRALDRRMERRAAALAALPAAAESVLHGDLTLKHAAFLAEPRDDAGAPYFFDFSDFSYGPVILDLAVMLAYLYVGSAVGVERWRQLRAWLLQGYESVFDLSESDRRSIDGALIERLLIEIRYVNRMSLRRGAVYEAAGLKKRYQLAAHLLGEGGPDAPRHTERAAHSAAYS